MLNAKLQEKDVEIERLNQVVQQVNFLMSCGNNDQEPPVGSQSVIIASRDLTSMSTFKNPTNVAAPQQVTTDLNNPENSCSNFDQNFLECCQKIVDCASRMECLHCGQMFKTTDFYDHIIVQGEHEENNQTNLQQSDYSIDLPLQ